MGYPGGKTHPFAAVSAFWRFSYPEAAPEVQLQQQRWAVARQSQSLLALASARQLPSRGGGASPRLQQEIRAQAGPEGLQRQEL